jgi:hypothetical protein
MGTATAGRPSCGSAAATPMTPWVILISTASPTELQATRYTSDNLPNSVANRLEPSNNNEVKVPKVLMLGQISQRSVYLREEKIRSCKRISNPKFV